MRTIKILLASYLLATVTSHQRSQRDIDDQGIQDCHNQQVLIRWSHHLVDVANEAEKTRQRAQQHGGKP